MRSDAPHPPAVSVLMAVYNGQDHVRQAIDGILQQSLRDFEFLIVDDGSTDRTAQILDEYADPRIVRLRHTENRGLIAALNTGLAAARGEFVARQDADDFSYPDRLRAQVDFLRARPHLALAGASWVFEPEGGEPRIRTVEPDPLRLAWMLLFKCPLPHCSMMFRRKVILDLGGYGADDKFVEDFALWSRVARSHRVGNLDQALVVRRRPAGSITARHGSEMGQAARRISLQNLQWVAGSGLSATERDLLQALMGNRPLPLAEALELETRELRPAAERLFQEFWARLGGTPAERQGFRRWAFAWMGSALLRKGLRLRHECARHPGKERIAGLRLARCLVLDAVRMNPKVIFNPQGVSEALRAMVSPGLTMEGPTG